MPRQIGLIEEIPVSGIRSRLWISAALFTSMATVSIVPGPRVVQAAETGHVFTIGNYPVEARAANAVTAKDEALATGQTAAFRSLLKRLVPVTSYQSLERVKSVDAATLIDGFQVRSERNSGTEYFASLDFSFQPDGVRNLLTGAGIPFVENQAPVTVVVPVTRDPKAAGAGGAFRPATGTWAAVWSDLDLTNALAPLKIETLKPEITPATLNELYGEGGNPIAPLSAAYRADRIVVAIAEPDREAKRVKILLAGADAAGPFSWSKTYRMADGDLAYTLELAAVVSHGVLEGRWKAIQQPGAVAATTPSSYGPAFDPDGRGAYGAAQPAFAGEEVAFEARYTGNGEWNEIRRRLLDTPGVDDIRISTVTGSSASISVKFAGGGAALAAAMARQGLAMTDEGGYWVVRTGGGW